MSINQLIEKLFTILLIWIFAGLSRLVSMLTPNSMRRSTAGLASKLFLDCEENHNKNLLLQWSYSQNFDVGCTFRPSRKIAPGPNVRRLRTSTSRNLPEIADSLAAIAVVTPRRPSYQAIRLPSYQATRLPGYLPDKFIKNRQGDNLASVLPTP